MDMMRKCRFKAFAFFEYSPEQRLSQPAPLLAITLQKSLRQLNPRRVAASLPGPLCCPAFMQDFALKIFHSSRKKSHVFQFQRIIKLLIFLSA